MLLKKLGLAVIGFSVLSQSCFAANAITYKNERGSVLELTLLPDNKIEGFFTTAVASKECQEKAIGKKQPIIGYTTGNVVSFSVVYPQCGSVLSVIGNFDDKQNIIDTMAILNRQATDIIHEGPGSRLIGHDTYKKIG